MDYLGSPLTYCQKQYVCFKVLTSSLANPEFLLLRRQVKVFSNSSFAKTFGVTISYLESKFTI